MLSLSIAIIIVSACIALLSLLVLSFFSPDPKPLFKRMFILMAIIGAVGVVGIIVGYVMLFFAFPALTVPIILSLAVIGIIAFQSK